MKILYLTTGCFDKGGVSRFSRYQASALRNLYGEENVRVVSYLGPDEHCFEEPFDVTWSGSTPGLVNKVRFVSEVTKQAIRWRPDLILSAHLHYAWFAHRLSRMVGAKSALNIYGLEVWSSPSPRCLTGLREMDIVIADCHNTADYVSDHQLRSQRPNVIWDPVDIDRFFAGDCSPYVLEKYNLFDKREHFVVLSLGRLSKAAAHKGYDRLIKAFAKVAAQHDQARLMICGRGDNVESLKSITRDLGIESIVRFPGGIDEKDLAEVYRAGTVFSLVSDQASGRGEGIPMTPLEAMACGLPIIVGNQDGSREAIVDDRNGHCIDPFDLERHAKVLCQWIDDREQLSHAQSEASHVAREVFSLDRFTQEHRSLLDASFNLPETIAKQSSISREESK